MSAILGLNRVEGKLSKYMSHVQSRVVDACRITQDQIIDQARKLVRKKTHVLERSIMNGPIQLRGTEVTATVTVLAPYAAAQEFGPSAGGRRKWGYTPYLRPAFKEKRDFFFKSLKWAMKP